jgi:NADH-quinone oxidoreductase subunit E
MAWLTKNSATTQIDRRSEPYVDEAMKSQLEPIVQRYPTRRAAALMVLHAVQDKVGYLPYQAIEEAAAFLDITPPELLDTATFYEEFFLQPKGRHVIWVCQSLSCEILGSEDLVSRVRDKLGIEPGETTPDGRFTLMHVECLGACGGAPCALVGEKLHENLTPLNLDEVLDNVE